MLPVDLAYSPLRPIHYTMLDKANALTCVTNAIHPQLEADTPKYLESEESKEHNGKLKISSRKECSQNENDVKNSSDQRLWCHRINLKNFKPEDIRVDSGSEDNTVSVTAKKTEEGKEEGGLEVRRTVFIPHGVDAHQISSYVNNEGFLVVQAPVTSKFDPQQCQKCNLKRKHDSIESTNKMLNVREDFQRKTENSFEDEENDGVPLKKCKLNENMEKFTSLASKKRLAFSVESLLGKNRSMELIDDEENKSEDKKCRSGGNPKSEKNEQINSPLQPSNEKENSKSQDVTSKSITTDSGASVLLSIPMKSFFPEEDKVCISLKDNTLSFKAERRVKIGEGELVESFLKEFTFPSSYDCKTMRLSRDKQGNVILCVPKKS